MMFLIKYKSWREKMSKRTYEEYIKNGCHPVGYNEPCQRLIFSQISIDLLLDQIDQLKQQLAEKDKEINSLIVDYEKRISQEQKLMSNMEHLLTEKQNAIDEINKEFVQAVHDWKALCAEKDEEIEDLKKWQDWYSMWHKKFQKQIEDLTTELETYRPTKLHGNGQCKCFNCNAINWTDWCSQYKGHIYCNKCLKDILKEEQTPQTQLAIQELEKVKTLIQNAINFEKPNFVEVYDAINKQIKELKGEKDVKD